MVGTTLAHYRIEEILGSGGMGIVYKAHDTRLERFGALKVMNQKALADETGRLRMLREARSAAALSHPHICTVHEVGETTDQIYIVMEYVEGKSLNKLIPPD